MVSITNNKFIFLTRKSIVEPTYTILDLFIKTLNILVLSSRNTPQARTVTQTHFSFIQPFMSVPYVRGSVIQGFGVCFDTSWVEDDERVLGVREWLIEGLENGDKSAGNIFDFLKNGVLTLIILKGGVLRLIDERLDDRKRLLFGLE